MRNKLVIGAIAAGVLTAPIAAVVFDAQPNFGNGLTTTTGGEAPPTAAVETTPVPAPAPSSMLQQQISQDILRKYTQGVPAAEVGTSVGKVTVPAPAVVPPTIPAATW